METTERNSLESLLEEAIGLAPERRVQFLERALAEDRPLRGALDSLLSQHESKPSLTDRLGRKVVREVLNAARVAIEGSVPGMPRCVSHFRITEKIGEGGMGVVYKARDIRLNRVVALKFLQPHLQANREARARFIHEATTACALDHPNLATIYEIGTTEPGHRETEGQPFIAMAYYEGETVKKKIEDGPMSLHESLNVACQIAQGLAKAHECGICHRDVKPANVIVTNDGLVKLVDFGLAKMAGISLTRTGAAMGSAAYMSPEQIRGEKVDDRTDVWSLGIVLYEMLTGRRPFEGEYEAAVTYSILHENPIPLRTLRQDISEKLEDIVMRCLEKEPRARYQTAALLFRDLSAVLFEAGSRKSEELHVERNSRSVTPQNGTAKTSYVPPPSFLGRALAPLPVGARYV